MKILVQLLFIGVLFSSCASKFGKVLKTKDNEYKYKMAEQYYVQKKYNYAQQLFEDLFPYVKGTARYEDMSYKYAYCAYYQNDYENAENLFKAYTENFPNSSRAEECEYMRAYSVFKQSPKVELDQTNTSKAMALMQAFINTHPDSQRNKDATAIIDKCREKLELKEYKSAELYYTIGLYQAAAVSYNALLDDYPDSEKGDFYKLSGIKSYYKYAQNSIAEKQEERYEKVVAETDDFENRFPDSKLKADVNQYKQLSLNSIKNLQNEQNAATTRR
ncbi:MAG: outer membrane protein assembly factor BamD [Chitinophagaceae bacterium]